MLLKIIQVGDKKLRRKSKPLTQDQIKSSEVQQLIGLMIDTMRDAPGVGLAAPQSGELKRIIVIEDKKDYQKRVPKKILSAQNRKPIPLTVIVNPQIKILDKSIENFFEGCLSAGRFFAVIPRSKKILVTGLDREGKKLGFEAEGWKARIIQHEIDHLDGVVCTDKMYPRTLTSEDNFIKYWRDATPEKISKLIK